MAPNEVLLKSGLGRALLAPNQPKLNAEALRILKMPAMQIWPTRQLVHLSTAYQRAGNQAMAALAQQRYSLIGDVKSAVTLAKRAAGLLPKGSPAWLRAQDLLRLDRKKGIGGAATRTKRGVAAE